MIERDTIFELLPAYFRRRDAESGGALRALFNVLEIEGAAVLEADLNAFEDSPFVETCAEDLLHEIGALIGAPRLRTLPPEALYSGRAFIGNLLRYRRAKGTPRALEMLARDITLYSAKVVEFYARLSTTPSMHAPRLDRPTTARMNDPDILAALGTAFDPCPRTPDMRSIARARGRYNIPNVGVFLWRLDAPPFPGPRKDIATPPELGGALPMSQWAGHAGHFALHPAGTATPLFMPQQNTDVGAPLPHQAPERLRRLPLKLELDAIASGTLTVEKSLWFNPAMPAFELYFRLAGETVFRRVPTANIRIGALTAPPYTQPLPFVAGVASGIEAALDPATARLVVRAPDPANAVKAVVAVRLCCALGQAGELGGGAYDRNEAGVDFRIEHGETLIYTVETGASGVNNRFGNLESALDAWKASSGPAEPGKRGFIVITENLIDEGAGNLTVTLPAGCDLTIVAAEWRLPEPLQPGDDPALQPQGYIIRRARRMLCLRRLQISGPATPTTMPGKLTLEGFVLDEGLLVQGNAAAELHLRHCVIDDAQAARAIVVSPGATQLSISLFRCVCASIKAAASLHALSATDTIFAAGAGIAAATADLDFQSVTVFAPVQARSMEASNSIFTADVKMARTQSGCLRYSFVGGEDNRLPRRFRCQPDLAWEAIADELEAASPAERIALRQRLKLAITPRFVDAGIGEPAFALPALDTPKEIAFGGEDDTEMGAFHFTGGAIRIANLTDLFDDFVPFGMEAGVISADRSSVDALRRNRP